MSYCVAYGCKNKKDRKDCRTKSFFGFPLKNLSLVKTWVKMLRRDNFQPSPYSKIYSDHFDESCFEYQPFTNRRQLKPGSIPTIFVFSKATSSRRVLDRCLPTTSTETYAASTSTEANVGMERAEISTTMEKESSKVSVGTQTVSFSEVIDLLAEKEAELKDLKIMLEEKKFVPENIKDDTKMKALTDSTVSRDFNYVTAIMYAKLKLLDIFPSKSMVIEYMPLPFRFGNKDVRIIVDCTEFPIQKPSSPMEQQLTFSRYKNTNTLKGMIGITPNGAISFISPLYCGSISDKQLFLKSKLMDRLEPNDVVMADKGFLISEELESIGCKLQCPIFLKDKIQFELAEMVSNSQLSNMRVTVERAISRVKQYKYFEGALPYRCLPHVHMVFFIACMLCNFHAPLIQVT
ncbi:THAP-type domain-containing protein [Nephila pilipes]|uniref:THAP-type domain-containing protein n=1 Tax=Nephila pilipes TaxID=299642 RepID=A0A8X6I9X6_NEPPI|nr:THAP-type domain-containing protein [Nephila pilipes]